MCYNNNIYDSIINNEVETFDNVFEKYTKILVPKHALILNNTINIVNVISTH